MTISRAPNGEFDWIVVDPEIDFAAMYARFSGLVMGRHSYDVFLATGGGVGPPLPTDVYSRTLAEGERDGVTFVRDAASHVRALRQTAEEKPLWLWGGGDLFRQLAGAGTGGRRRCRDHADHAGRRHSAAATARSAPLAPAADAPVVGSGALERPSRSAFWYVTAQDDRVAWDRPSQTFSHRRPRSSLVPWGAVPTFSLANTPAAGAERSACADSREASRRCCSTAPHHDHWFGSQLFVQLLSGDGHSESVPVEEIPAGSKRM